MDTPTYLLSVTEQTTHRSTVLMSNIIHLRTILEPPRQFNDVSTNHIEQSPY